MNYILLSGGSGQRLWPLSNDVRAKQFLEVFTDAAGRKQSMLQRMHAGIVNHDDDARVTIATSLEQKPFIENQLEAGVELSVEPCRRDTFGAIVLAGAYLRDAAGVADDEVVVVCPVDSYVEEAYYSILQDMGRVVGQGLANLALMGIRPEAPSDKYGYIIPENQAVVSKVREFKEKPDLEGARTYISQGALINGGVFAFKLGYLLERGHELLDFKDYQDLYDHYADIPRISFDYALVEKEKNIAVVQYSGKWKDLGTWDTLTEELQENKSGKAVMEDCQDSYVLNELGVPIIALGLSNIVVAASPQGILVADRNKTNGLKEHVNMLHQQTMYAKKSWGSYTVLNASPGSMTINVELNAGHRMNYHSHQHRNEVWTVVSGEGYTVVDDMRQPVAPGDVVTIAAGCRHTVCATSDMQIIEVQLGQEISVDDKQLYEDEL